MATMGLDPHYLVLAHQGGWDEMLMVAAPIGLFVGLLRMANKRAEALQAEQDADGTGPESPAGERTVEPQEVVGDAATDGEP